MRKEYLIIFKILGKIWMLIDEINVAEWFRVESPSLARCKEGDLPLLNFSNLTCMGRCAVSYHVSFLVLAYQIGESVDLPVHGKPYLSPQYMYNFRFSDVT